MKMTLSKSGKKRLAEVLSGRGDPFQPLDEPSPRAIASEHARIMNAPELKPRTPIAKKKRVTKRPPGKYGNEVERFSLIRHSGIVKAELEEDARIVSAWRLQMSRTRTLYRARDGKLWGLPHRIEGELTPERFIEFGVPSEHNPLGEMYPSSWQQLEDAKGGCGWLRNKEQELLTLKFLESVEDVPTVLDSWVHVKRTGGK